MQALTFCVISNFLKVFCFFGDPVELSHLKHNSFLFSNATCYTFELTVPDIELLINWNRWAGRRRVRGF